MQEPICMCHLLPQLETETRLIVIVHLYEIGKPTNTGALAAKCLRNSEIHVRGLKDAPTFSSASINAADRVPLVLFPSDDAVTLTPEFVQQLGKPVTLVVPDGNWKQASRMPKRIPELKNMQRVILPLGEPTEYRLRHEPRKPHGLATMEAIARAMRILEGEEVYQQMMEVFRIMVARSLWAKGVLPYDQVYGGLPSNVYP
jgi:DTW domain-containing protein YfiP